MQFFIFALDNWFPRVLLKAPNSELFFEMTDIDTLGDLVVAKLREIKSSDKGHNWYQNKELIGLFDRLHKCDCMSMPSDPVDRIRWIALACILFSQQREFSYGNILIPLDYVPNEHFEDYDHYGSHLIEEVKKFRAELKEKGWKSLL